MSESSKVAKHIHHLASHVNRRLKTTDAFKWIMDGTWPDVERLDVDVRDCITKIKKLEHRYQHLYDQRKASRVETGLHSDDSMVMYNCCVSERKWVLEMWKKGDWDLDEDMGDYVKHLEGYEGGKFRWRREQKSNLSDE